jgi:hypothetical protein
MRTLTLLVVALTCVVGCNRSGETVVGATAPPATTRASAPGTSAEAVARDYAKLTLVTPKAVLVNPEMAMYCRGVSQADVERARKTQGPHAHTRIRIFMNAGAAEAFELRRKDESPSPAVYPVGSIVVKEKKGESIYGGQAGRSKTHDGVGGMIKREKGYDPEYGDWEYFYFEDPAKVESGRIASCVACHAGAATTDYVFGYWAKQIQ